MHNKLSYLGNKWTPQIVLFSIFFVYSVVFLIVVDPQLSGDQIRHAGQAINLANGFYISPDRLWISNGPGYPLILSIFATLNIDWWWAKLLNPVFITVALWFLYLLLVVYLPKDKALIGVIAAAMYYPFILDLRLLHSEALTHMLVAAWAYFFCDMWRKANIKTAVIAGLVFAYLCLTKVIFGYLLVICLLFFSSWLIISRDRRMLLVAASFVVAAFACAPYLFYTQSMTGKIFHWADSGFTNLYWMSSPYPNDSGSWYQNERALSLEELSPHHEFIRHIDSLPHEKRSKEFAKKAIENIKSNPEKYFKNWIANVGRTIFNFPYDYTPQTLRTYFYIIPNSIFIYFLIRAINLYIQHKPKIPIELLLIALAGLTVYGGTTLIHATPRMVRPLLFLILPILIVTFMQTYLKKKP